MTAGIPRVPVLDPVRDTHACPDCGMNYDGTPCDWCGWGTR